MWTRWLIPDNRKVEMSHCPAAPQSQKQMLRWRGQLCQSLAHPVRIVHNQRGIDRLSRHMHHKLHHKMERRARMGSR